MEVFDSVVLAAKTLKDMKADNIVVVDLSKGLSIAKYFIFATSSSNVQGRASGNAVEKALTDLGVELFGKEGAVQSDWVVLDYYDFVVHIMTKEVREYYNLDKLWGDGKNTKKFETIEKDLEEKRKKEAKKSEKAKLSQEKSAAKKIEKAQKETTKKEEKKKEEKPKKVAKASKKADKGTSAKEEKNITKVAAKKSKAEKESKKEK